MIKVIIFDFDGVIENNYEEHFAMSKKQIKDITIDEHKKLFEGNIHEQREKLKHRLTGFDLPTHFDKLKHKALIKKEILDELKILSKIYKLGVITSGKEEGMKKYVENNKLEGIFSFIYGLDTHKLKSEKFKLALESFNVKKEDCIFITDTLGDILEANKIGIKTIASGYGYHEPERLKRGNPIHIVSKFSEISPIVEKLSKSI